MPPGTADGRDGDLGPDERALLDAFDRLSPQDDLHWCFDNAMRRIATTDGAAATSAAPWQGLPDDLWERGLSAKVGRRFVGDVAGVLAELLAADARRVVDEAGARRQDAVWDALRYLVARVADLEARVDPSAVQPAELDLPDPDTAAWHDAVVAWSAAADPALPLLVGELGDGALFDALRAAGRTARGIDPRGRAVWERHRASGGDAPDLVLDDVRAHLRSLAEGAASGVVLAGCVDRLDLPGKVDLVHEALRATAPGGPVVVLVTDQGAWDAAIGLPARDLLPGRPLHPETWSFLLGKAGAVGPAWHRPPTGATHAVVAGAAP